MGLVKVTMRVDAARSGVVLDGNHLVKEIWPPKDTAPAATILRRSADVETETCVQGLAMGVAPRVAVNATVTAVPAGKAVAVVKVIIFGAKLPTTV